VAIVIAMLTTMAWVLYKTPSGNTVKVTAAAEYLGIPQNIDANGAEIVVLPEYGLDNTSTENVRERIGGSAYFVGSKQTSVEEGLSNTLIFGSTEDGFLEQQQKTRLIPGGEYLSYTAEVLLRLFDEDTYVDFQLRRQVVKGSGSLTPFKVDDKTVLGSAVCSSIINPEDYRGLTNQGATLLTNSASLEIFRGSSLFAWQHRGLATFMAVANARPYVQASNNWPAFVLDHNGKKLAETNPSNTATVDIATNTRKTPYTMFGEWAIMLGAFWFAYDLVQFWRKRYKTKT